MARAESWEGPHLERLGSVQMAAQFARLDALEPLVEVEVVEGSQLYLDGLANPYDSPADQVVTLEAGAEDHLAALRTLIETNQTVHLFATYTLIRGSLESSARALWLLTSGTRDKRVFRSLQFILHNRDMVEPLAKAWNLLNVDGYKNMRAKLAELHQALPRVRSKKLEAKLTITAMLDEADRQLRTKGDWSGRQVRQACSGAAHGNKTTMGLFTERRRVSDDGPRGIYMVTPSFFVTARMLEITVDYLVAVHEIYRKHAAL